MADSAVPQLLGSFNGSIKPVRSTFFYQISTIVVAVLMICLPLVYLAITIGAGYGVYWYAINATDVLEAGRGKGRILAVVIGYLGPLVAGSILALFMVKPFFAPRGRQAEGVSVSEKDDPYLHEFVGTLCESIGAPKPKRIDVVCDVNASASFRRGWLSMLGNDLVLTIGLPLVSCMSVRQLTGVLAHEFGHFSQGVGMRASYIIGSVNHWFARVVYQRDALDEKLDQWAERSGEIHGAIAIVFYITKLCVWLTRRVLWLLMMIGHLFSSILSRQMEFDADRHAYRAVGSDAFSSALKELPLIVTAEQGAYQDLGQAYQEERLVDNLPALIHANSIQIPDEYRKRIIQDGMTHNTGMYDSHPCTKDRIQMAETGDGIFDGSGNAASLFSNYDGLCKKVTLNYYRDMIGLNMRGLQLVPTGSVVAQVEEQAQGAEALQRYFLGCFTYRPFLQVKSLSVKGNITAAAVKQQLQKTYQKLVQDRLQIIAANAEFMQLDDKRDRENAGRIPKDASKDPMAHLDEQASPWKNSYDSVAAFGKLFNQRLNLAMMLAEVENGLIEYEQLQQVKACFTAMSQLGNVEEKFFVLRAYLVRMEIVIEKIQADPESRVNYHSLENSTKGAAGILKEIKEGLGDVAYPFDHRQDDVTLAKFLVNGRISSRDPQAVYELSQSVLQNTFTLISRIMITLAVFGETVDEACALQPVEAAS